MPTFVEIRRNEIVGYASIANKPGRGLNCVLTIDKSDITCITDLFSVNPKYITAKQILEDNETNIEKLAEYNFYIDLLKKNSKPRGLKNENEVRKDLKERIAWYQSISINGYDRQSDTKLDFNCEVQVAVMGKAKFLKVNGGNHRYAAYELLKIDRFIAHPIAYDADFLKSFGNKRGYKVIWSIWKSIENV